MSDELADLARRCLNETEGNFAAALQRMNEQVVDAGLVPDAAKLGCTAALERIRSGHKFGAKPRASADRAPTRSAAVTPAKADPPGLIVGYETLAVANLKSLLDFPVADGLKLADADRLLLAKRAAELSATASQFKVLSSWCGRIGKLLAPGQKVKDRLDDQQLRTLYHESLEAERREKRIISDPMAPVVALNGNGHRPSSPSAIAPPSKAQLMGAR